MKALAQRKSGHAPVTTPERHARRRARRHFATRIDTRRSFVAAMADALEDILRTERRPHV